MSLQNRVMIAIQMHNFAVARELIENGEPVNVNDANGYSLLNWAIIHAPIDFIQFLISRGADLNFEDECGFRPINATYVYTPRLDVLELLVANGADITLRSGKRYPATYLEWAMYRGHTDFVQFFLRKGLPIPPPEDVVFFPCAKPDTHDAIRRLITNFREWKTTVRGVAEFAAAAEEPAMLTQPSKLSSLPPELIGVISSYLRPSGTAPRGKVPSMWKIRQQRNPISE